MRTVTKIMEVKSVGTFPTITVKLATSPLSPQTMLTFQQKESSNGSFFGHTAVLGGWERERGGGEVEGMIPLKPSSSCHYERSLLCTNFLEGFFHSVPSNFDLHCRTTVVPLQTATTPFFYSGGR